MSSSRRRYLLIADVGNDARRHIGDEAMLEANLESLRRVTPDAAFTVASSDPEWVAARYGVEGVPLFGFRDGDAPARNALLDEILAGNAGSATGEAVASADAIVISGGGNLSSTWPHLLYERVALLRLARRFEKPAVVLGQTLGPRLDPDERLLLADALAGARFLGVRELPSAALAAGLGIPQSRLWYQCDDAMFLEDGAAPPRREPRIAVTIDPQVRAAGDTLFDALAAQLREISRRLGAPLVFVPHAFGNAPSDLTEAILLAERVGLADSTIREGLTAREARCVAAEAALVISTRYHPIVFALGAGVPALGIYGDDYCRTKLQGALAHAGLQRWTLTYDELRRGALLARALDLWSARDIVGRQLEARREAWRDERRERWSAIARALSGDEFAENDPARLFGRPLGEVAPALVSALDARREWLERERAALEEACLRREAQLGWRPVLAKLLAAVRRRLRRG